MKTRKALLSVLLFCPVVLLGLPQVHAQGLQQELADVDVGRRWKYNDWEAAKAAAAISKKPILALFR